MRPPSPALRWVRTVAERLGDLVDEVVFLGGAAIELVLTDPAAAPARPTMDVDVIVEIGSWPQYVALQRKLRQRGFHEDVDEEAPLCRWVVDGIKVDVMPTAADILGFANRWYAQAVEGSVWHRLDDGLTIRRITAPYFMATKLEAFDSRGDGDYQASADLEDVVALVDGRAELENEIAGAPTELLEYLRTRTDDLLGPGLPRCLTRASPRRSGEPEAASRAPAPPRAHRRTGSAHKRFVNPAVSLR